VKKITAAQVMTRNVKTVGPEWPMTRLLQFLSDNAITGAPVVNEGHEPIGVVSLTDVARNGSVGERAPSADAPAYYRQGLEGLVDRHDMKMMHVETESTVTVRDIMTPLVFAVDETTDVQEVAEMMITGRIHRVFVRNAGKMVGIITSMDLLPLLREL
jgi:predicted transcriptional regulator